MKHAFQIFSVVAFFWTSVAQAQLSVTVSPPQIVSQKAVVKLAMTNDLTEPVESARAVIFLMDDQGKMVGQSSRWVIGGTKDRPALAPNQGTTFNFVVTSSRSFTTNLTAKIAFSRVVLSDGKLADVKQSVSVNEAAK